MQDFQPLHGRIFCSGGGTTDSGGGRAELGRIVGYPAMSPRHQQPPPPAKCPRCDSVNTKFCYYNNYNLSQPRHFCKSCRRYWTMGGVLRNVPVGGGCRKSKRPASKPSKPPLDTAEKDQLRRRRPSSAFHCSSDSSSLSATTASASVTSTTSTSLPDPALLPNRISTSNPIPQYDQLPDVDAPLCPASDVFQDPATGVFTGKPPALLGFGFHDPPPAQEKREAIRPEFADQTIPVDPRPSSGDGYGIPSLDWAGQVDPTFYDLTCAVDPSSYWNPSHWSDPDPSLYLPYVID